jgi:hypothetical protein
MISNTIRKSKSDEMTIIMASFRAQVTVFG